MKRPPAVDTRTPAERKAARVAFEIAMRQASIEYTTYSGDGAGPKELDFDEFSTMIRDREIGIHSERRLLERFSAPRRPQLQISSPRPSPRSLRHIAAAEAEAQCYLSMMQTGALPKAPWMRR